MRVENATRKVNKGRKIITMEKSWVMIKDRTDKVIRNTNSKNYGSL